MELHSDMVDSDGVAVDPKKVIATQDPFVLFDQASLQFYLELAGYY